MVKGLVEQKFPMTAEGGEQLQKELNELETTKQDYAKRRIARAEDEVVIETPNGKRTVKIITVS